VKFKLKSNDRLREHLQCVFANGIIIAARNWMRRGSDPSHECAEFYQHLIDEANHA
jgi:hypothetical protein